jgi:hypothetical protein
MGNSWLLKLRIVWQMLVLALALAWPAVPEAIAHQGPPFPILMDRLSAGFRVSVWADPDIGEAYFYVIVETPDGQRPQTVPEVSLWTKPISGRLKRITYAATQQNLKSHLQFEVEPYFDQGDMWDIGIQIEAPGHSAGELVAQVESTPPGYGMWDLAIYLFPFVLMGGMWVVAVVRRMRYDPQEESEVPAEECDSPQPEPAIAAN